MSDYEKLKGIFTKNFGEDFLHHEEHHDDGCITFEIGYGNNPIKFLFCEEDGELFDMTWK